MLISEIEKQRNFGLDVIRSIAILLVLFAHVIQISIPYLGTITKLLFGIASNITGYFGVELFFVLSGFLIGQIIAKEYQKTDYGVYNIRTFYMRRWLRTLPLYYLFLVIYLFYFIISHFYSINFKTVTPLFLSYFVFLQNSFQAFFQTHFKETFGFYGQSWSLCVEEWFYLLLPLLFFIYKKATIDIKLLYKYITRWILIFLLIRTVVTLFSGLGLWDIQRIIFIRFDSLLIGVLFAVLKMNNKEIYNKFLNKKNIILSFIIIFFLGLHLLFNQLSIINKISAIFLKTSFWTILCFAFGVLIINAEESSFLNKKLIKINFLKNFFEKISLYSYSIYLSHALLLTIGIQKLHINNSVLLINILLTIATIYFLGHFLYNSFEKPIMDLREKF